MSSYLLWRQTQGDLAVEIVSIGSKINMWVMVSHLLKYTIEWFDNELSTEVSAKLYLGLIC